MRCTSSSSDTLPRPYEFIGNSITWNNQRAVARGRKRSGRESGRLGLIGG